MKFTPIKIENWVRKGHYEHYRNFVPCTYSVTTNLDITPIIESKSHLYSSLIYLISTVVNQYDEFKTAINSDGVLGVYDELYPCYTIFNKDTETFSNIWTEYKANYSEFKMIYEDDVKNMEIQFL